MYDGWTGIDWLLPLQDLRTSLPDFITRFFEIISSELFYLVIPFIIAFILYWFVDKRAGDRLTVNMLSAYNLCNFIKFLVKQPRPWILNSDIHPTEESLRTAKGYSLPSGHSSLSTAGYGTLAFFSSKKWIKILCIVIIALIVFARLFLSVHTPLDVIIGILIGVSVIIANVKILDYADRSDNAFYIISAAYLVLFTIFFISIVLTMDIDNVNVLLAIGLFYGTFIGRIIDRAYLKYEIPKIPTKKKIIFTLIGLIVAGILFAIPLKLVKVESVAMVCGVIISLWMYVIYPKIITKWSLS